MNITKLVSQFLDLRNTRYDFCNKAKNLDLNKEKEGSEVTLTAGPACQGRLPHSRGDSRR